MRERKVLLGNEAIAYGLIENGCSVATSYPGTPASEILATLVELKNNLALEDLYIEWSVNEKVAFEIALTASYTGLRTASMMKQVGLNVASDPLMSSAYTGTKGGFIIVSADDPGPYSSQTEQDSRFFAMFAKIPVLDPSSPREAKDVIKKAYEISETYEIPVMVRPTTKVCHARQDIEITPFARDPRSASFEKNPQRWAATPKFRYLLHKRLNEKIAKIANESSWSINLTNKEHLFKNSPKAIISSGIASSYVAEVLQNLGLWDTIPLLKILMPYPLCKESLYRLLKEGGEVLVIEETYPVIELQIRKDGLKVLGRETGHVPQEGELIPDVIEDILNSWLKIPPRIYSKPVASPELRPTLCPGCGHRPLFFAIRKAFPKGIYPSDIGCYTLGLNLGSVDTVLCMGAAISQGIGFSKAYPNKEIIATIGDSTFFHAGIPPLINAVASGASFIVVILDNETTAMTGHQPTPETSSLGKVSIENVVRGCGVEFVEKVNTYNLQEVMDALRRAGKYAFEEAKGMAVIIAKSPCVTSKKTKASLKRVMVRVTEKCNGCQLCVKRFECPAIESQGRKRPVKINHVLCAGCGVCVQVCPYNGIEVVS